jgi:hypothetical protein
MGPGASAVGLHWSSVPVVGPPTLAIAVAVGLVSIALLVALFLIDALADREQRQPAARPGAARPAAALGEPPAVGPAGVADAGFPDLSQPELRQLALARLRRFAAVADDPPVRADGDRQRLARWAVFSAYRDCAALGLEPEAREVLRARSGHAGELADGLSRMA